MHKGWILSDIDGTLTVDRWSLPELVVSTLTTLHEQGWSIALVSGRTLPHCERLLSQLNFPYLLAVHNGALLLEMPKRRIMAREYLTLDLLQDLSTLMKDSRADWVVYGGCENEDRCFYSPSCWSSDLLQYIHGRRDQLEEGWHALPLLTDLPITEFVAAKSFGPKDELTHAYKHITHQLGLHAPLITDPYNESYGVLQVTGGDGNKGQAGLEILAQTGLQGPVIAAGNDLNDIPLLQMADLSIAMEDGPDALLSLAHITAPSAKERGICSALIQATKRFS